MPGLPGRVTRQTPEALRMFARYRVIRPNPFVLSPSKDAKTLYAVRLAPLILRPSKDEPAPKRPPPARPSTSRTRPVIQIRYVILSAAKNLGSR
jgi:hypothetical protein